MQGGLCVGNLRPGLRVAAEATAACLRDAVGGQAPINSRPIRKRRISFEPAPMS